MINYICKPEKCTACYACSNVCSHNAITFVKNRYGALYPSIDEKKCTKCNVCRKICPSNNKCLNFRYPLACYAAWRKDKTKRKRSASGGIASCFSEYCITALKGGVVGAKLTDNFEVVFDIATELKDLETFKGSQYVHSHILNTYNKVKDFLETGKKILFIGLPCQIAGLYSFLKIDYENLITCDLICHGVCPASYFKDEIDFIRKKYKLAEMSHVSFRNNAGNNFCFVLYDVQGDMCFKRRAYLEPYFNSFLQAITLRDNCYACLYARPERISDITLGDYINLGKDMPFDGQSQNNSIVIINTGKGRNFFSDCVKTITDVQYVERDYKKALPFQPSLLAAFPLHKLTPQFRELYLSYGFAKAIRKTLRFDIIRRYIEFFLYCLLHFYKIPRKVLKCLKK